jgi:hypothetical protein
MDQLDDCALCFQAWFVYISLALLSFSLLLCFALACVSPYFIGLRKSAGNSNDTTFGPEFWITCLLISIEIFLLSQELRKSSSISVQNDVTALHTL